MNGLFGVNGLLGFIVAVVLLLSIVFFLGYNAVRVQAEQASNPYAIENIEQLQGKSTQNAGHYQILKK